MEIGIEPTARHAADLGIIPVIFEDACGAGHADAAQCCCEALRFAGDAVMTAPRRFAPSSGDRG
jgi:nicotinamidase-related amidase